MQLIDGKKISAEMKEEIKLEVERAKSEFWAPIGLAVIRVGDNPASEVYVRNKVKDAEEVGIKSFLYELPDDIEEDVLIDLIELLNGRSDVNGILVQLPLPKHISEKTILNKIDVRKDVDGFSPYQMGKLIIGEPDLVACTPKGVMEMLARYDINVDGMNAVVVGRSNIVGKPMAQLLLAEDATVTVCHRKTKDLKEYTKRADILVVAVGKPNLITADMVKDGAIVVDVGINRLPDGRLVGDVDFENVKDKCSYITPVPGGVGLMTRVMLLKNTLKAYKEQNAR